MPIVRTKLYAPSVPRDHVRRERLLTLLDRALQVPLTLVSAPAGYGKSVLVSNWIRCRERPVAWLSLDETDGDLRQFGLYLLAALDQAFTVDATEIEDLLAANELAPVPVLAGHLLNCLDAIDGACVIVLDDYHRLPRGSAVHELLTSLLEHPAPNFHLVLLTRRDPPLPLNALRAGTLMAEIRLADLRFTATEAAELLVATAGLTVSEVAMANLQRELEGWAAGLRLVVLAIRRAVDPEAFLSGLHGGIPQTQQYLLSEVLSGLLLPDRTVLLKSSILNRYCAELIEAVCGADDSSVTSVLSGRAFVEFLQQSNLFSISLDSDDRWFRYHHLFQALLQHQLRSSFSADEIAELHTRASAWFETQGEIAEAVRHAFAGPGEELAGDIVERHRREMLEQDRWFVVQRWLDQLPADLIHRRPDLLMAQAWVACYQFDMVQVASSVEQFGALNDPAIADPFLQAESNYFQSVLAYWSGQGDLARDCGERALGVFRKDPGMMAGEVLVYVVLGQQMSGYSESASELLNAEKAALSAPAGDRYMSRLHATDAFFNVLMGRLQVATTAAKYFDDFAEQCGGAFTRAWSSYLHAVTQFHSFQLDEARQKFDLVIPHRNIVERKMGIDALAGLALSYALMQRPEDAMLALEKLDDFANEMRDPELNMGAASCRARVGLLLGDLESPLAWARSVAPEAVAASLFLWLDSPYLSQARVCIVAGAEAEQREALRSLDQLRQQLETLHNVCKIIDVDLLRAVALSKLGRSAEARDVLRAAVAMAAPGGWIRPFVELGQPMAGLLAELDFDPAHRTFVKRVLASFSTVGTTASVAKAGPRKPAASPNVVALKPASEELTNREMDILELLRQRLQDKEIAAKLFISTHTVNHHLKHIYQKLNARNRRQAVSKAVAIGILAQK